MQPLETAPRKRGRPVGADSAETRNRILRAAREVINKCGYQAATFQAIAMEAGLTRPSVHNYFASREQIYNTLAAEGRDVMAACIAAVQDRDTLRGQLSALVGALYDAEQRDRSKIAFLVTARMEAVRNPELNIRSGIGINELLEEMVREAILRGELPADAEVDAIVDMLQALMWGLGFYAGFIDTAADMAPMHALLDRAMAQGLLAAAGGADSANDTSGDTPGTVVRRP
jgi:AcrR family transcriptional regulator